MKYKVHKLNIDLKKETEELENFINNLKGEVISIIPNVETLFLCYGAKIRTVVIIERIEQ